MFLAKNPKSMTAPILVVGDTQSDSIQCLNAAKKWSIQYSIQNIIAPKALAERACILSKMGYY